MTNRRLKGLVVMELGGAFGVLTLYHHLQSAGIWLAASAVASIAAWVGGWKMMMPKEEYNER